MGGAPRAFLPAVYLLALALPLGVAPAEIGLGAGLLLWAASLLVHHGPWTASPVDGPLGLFLAAGFLSAAFAPSPMAASRAAISGWTLLSFFLAKEAAAEPRTVRRLLVCLLATSLVAASLGIAQRFVDVAPLLDALGAPEPPHPALAGGRVSGFFNHHMTFAGQQAVLVVAFLILAAGGYLLPRIGIAWILPLSLMALALIFTAARGAFAACLLTLAGGAWLVRARRLRWRAAGAVLGIVVLALAAGPILRHRLGSWGQEAPGPGRPRMWLAATEILRERPLLGAGAEGYRLLVPAHLDVSSYHPPHAHSNFFQVAADGGMVGLILYLFLWASFYGALLPRAWRMHRRGDPRASLLSSAVLAVSCFHLAGLVEFNLGDSEVAMLTFFLAGLPFGRAFYGKAAP